jgi:hypothetical protein
MFQSCDLKFHKRSSCRLVFLFLTNILE